MRNHKHFRDQHGFSLIEVMIAVVVLTVGLLALASLQAKLSTNSADAKARSRVAALVTSVIDYQRAQGYNQISPILTTDTNPATTTFQCVTTSPTAIQSAICAAQSDASLTGVVLNQTVTRYYAAPSAGSFSTTAPTATVYGDYKQIRISATWTDATNNTHSLVTNTIASNLGLTSTSNVLTQDLTTSASLKPIVHELNPGNTAGVLPIALGNGDSSAASNPTPELEGSKKGQQIVGTSFNVLTYTPGGTTAVIQKRFENTVIKCTCQYGAGGANLDPIDQTAQWPAIWTGERYDVYVPDSDTDAPGEQYSSGPKSGVTQSPYCTECCRDHHDNNTTGVAKFDPEAHDSDGNWAYQKYNLSGSTLIAAANTTDATYVDSCRLIRVDGLWRTAADMYSRQFGLLETEPVAGVKAKTGVPTTDTTTAYTVGATEGYTEFVKAYLKQYDGSTGSAPTNAQTLYDDTSGGYNLNNPASITISSPSTSDNRYLHGRGLYVDYLEEPARDYLSKLLASKRAQSPAQCLVGGTDLADCVLPYLPFTTINLTEIADWAATVSATDLTPATDILDVNTKHVLGTDSTEPSGGRTRGIAVGQANTTATMRTSNSGVAATTAIAGATDKLGDETTVNDSQAFDVGGTGNTGDKFTVTISGGGGSTQPYYTFGSDTGECNNVVDPVTGLPKLTCTTNTTLGTVGLPGSVRLENYWKEDTTETNTSQALNGVQCTYDGSAVNIQDTTINVPTFRNYQVQAATAAGVPGVVGSPVNDGTKSETTTASFLLIPKNSVVAFTLAEESVTPATLVSCTATRTGNKGQGYKYSFNVGTAVWNPATFP